MDLRISFFMLRFHRSKVFLFWPEVQVVSLNCDFKITVWFFLKERLVSWRPPSLDLIFTESRYKTDYAIAGAGVGYAVTVVGSLCAAFGSGQL